MKKCLCEMHQFELTDPVGASTIILFKDIDKYAFMCGSNFNETDVRSLEALPSREDRIDLVCIKVNLFLQKACYYSWYCLT